MKRITLSLVFMVIATMLFAQKTISINDFTTKSDTSKYDGIQTVMSTVELKRIGVFGGPMMTYTQIDGEFAFMMGGGGGIIINNMYFGGYGSGLSNYVRASTGNQTDHISFGHGGFLLGYEMAHERIIHPVLSTKIGWGQAQLVAENEEFKDNVFVVAPSISAEINFTRYFKVNVGVEYHQTLGISKLTDLKDKNFSGFGVNLNFAFGWF